MVSENDPERVTLSTRDVVGDTDPWVARIDRLPVGETLIDFDIDRSFVKLPVTVSVVDDDNDVEVDGVCDSVSDDEPDSERLGDLVSGTVRLRERVASLDHDAVLWETDGVVVTGWDLDFVALSSSVKEVDRVTSIVRDCDFEAEISSDIVMV
jgi:hypothetical protein